MSLSCAVGKLMTQIEGMAGEWERAPRTQMGSRNGGDKMLFWSGSEQKNEVYVPQQDDSMSLWHNRARAEGRR